MCYGMCVNPAAVYPPHPGRARRFDTRGVAMMASYDTTDRGPWGYEVPPPCRVRRLHVMRDVAAVHGEELSQSIINESTQLLRHNEIRGVKARRK